MRENLGSGNSLPPLNCVTSRGSSLVGQTVGCGVFGLAGFTPRETKTRRKASLNRARTSPLPAAGSGGSRHARLRAASRLEPVRRCARGARESERGVRGRLGSASAPPAAKSGAGGHPSGRESEDGPGIRRPKRVTANSPTHRMVPGGANRAGATRGSHTETMMRDRRGAHPSIVTVRGRQHRSLATSDPGAADHPRPRRSRARGPMKRAPLALASNNQIGRAPCRGRV